MGLILLNRSWIRCIRPYFDHPSWRARPPRKEKRRWCRDIRRLLGQLVAVFTPHALDLKSLSRLLQQSRLTQTTNITDDYQSLIDIPKDGSGLLQIHHPYFADFLFGEKVIDQDLNFNVNQKGAHSIMVENCLKVMCESLKRDIFRYRDPCTLVTDMRKGLLSSELQYACRYWAEHLIQSKNDGFAHEYNNVWRFLETHFIHWLVSMSIFGLISEAVSVVHKLQYFF